MSININKAFTIRAMAVALSLATLVACGVFDPVDTPNLQHYQISLLPSHAVTTQCNQTVASAPTIQVTRVKVFAPFDNRNMYYSLAKYQLDSYTMHKWVTGVDAMLTQAIQQKLSNSCIFAHVVNADFMITARYRLNSQLINLTQNISGSTATLNFSILVQLVDNRSNQVAKSKTFIINVPTTPNPRGYVDGANKAVAEFLNQLVSWLRA